MVTGAQRGFSLVEVVIVLAISGLLLLIALSGFGAARDQSEFSQSVDGAKESVEAAKAAASASVNDRIEAAGGNNTCTIVLGERINFTVGSSSLDLQQLQTKNPQLVSCGAGANPPVTATVADPPTAQLKFGLVYIGFSNGSPGGVIAQPYHLNFYRSITDARSLVSSSTTLATNYGMLSTAMPTPVNLWFKTVDGKKAYITVDTTGGITRTIQ